jgi:hypothetical protein
MIELNGLNRLNGPVLLSDHLIRLEKNRFRNCEAKLLGRL